MMENTGNIKQRIQRMNEIKDRINHSNVNMKQIAEAIGTYDACVCSQINKRPTLFVLKAINYIINTINLSDDRNRLISEIRKINAQKCALLHRFHDSSVSPDKLNFYMKHTGLTKGRLISCLKRSNKIRSIKKVSYQTIDNSAIQMFKSLGIWR